MFNIDEAPTFTETVKVVSPDGSTGDFKASFLALDLEVYDTFDLTTSSGSEKFLAAALHAIDDVIDGAGNPVSDSPGLRHRLLQKSWVRLALARSYHEGINRGSRGN